LSSQSAHRGLDRDLSVGENNVSKIYEVRSSARSDGKVHAWGARHSRADAEALLRERIGGERAKWAEEYHERWWIWEIDTTGSFEIPSAPAPRARFRAQTTTVAGNRGTWDTLRVEILDETGRIVGGYDRNHPNLYGTFEPFRQGGRMMALISPDYTATSVMDLSSEVDPILRTISRAA